MSLYDFMTPTFLKSEDKWCDVGIFPTSYDIIEITLLVKQSDNSNTDVANFYMIGATKKIIHKRQSQTISTKLCTINNELHLLIKTSYNTGIIFGYLEKCMDIQYTMFSPKMVDISEYVDVTSETIVKPNGNSFKDAFSLVTSDDSKSRPQEDGQLQYYNGRISGMLHIETSPDGVGNDEINNFNRGYVLCKIPTPSINSSRSAFLYTGGIYINKNGETVPCLFKINSTGQLIINQNIKGCGEICNFYININYITNIII